MEFSMDIMTGAGLAFGMIVVAVMVFMGAGMATTYVIRHVL